MHHTRPRMSTSRQQGRLVVIGEKTAAIATSSLSPPSSDYSPPPLAGGSIPLPPLAAPSSQPLKQQPQAVAGGDMPGPLPAKTSSSNNHDSRGKEQKKKRDAVFRDPAVMLHQTSGREGLTAAEVTVFEANDGPTEATSYTLQFEAKVDVSKTIVKGSVIVKGSLHFENLYRMVIAWSQGDMPKEFRLTGEAKGKAIDAAMRKWIISGIPPERVVLIRWLLWRAVLTPAPAGAEGDKDFSLVFVGADDPTDQEEDGEDEHNRPHGADANDMLDDEDHGEGDDSESGPPSYFSNGGDPDELPPPPYSEVASLEPPPPYEDIWSVADDVPEVGEEEVFKEWDRDLLVAYQRPDAVKTVDRSGWDHYRWRLTLELKKSHRDLEDMRDLRRRQRAVRRAREVELLTKMNVLRHKQKSETLQNRKTKQMVYDVLDLHEMMETMKMESKRLTCQIMKDREKIFMLKQPYHLRRGKHQKGAHLGDGPIPYPATTRLSNNPESRAAKQYQWDAHGRRHQRHGPPPPGNFYEEAIKVIINLSSSGFERHLCLHRAFKHFDRNGDRKITLSEFATALQVLKPKPSTEQLMTLFRLFDPNSTGAINYGEFLTQFFSRREFLRAMATNHQGGDERKEGLDRSAAGQRGRDGDRDDRTRDNKQHPPSGARSGPSMKARTNTAAASNNMPTKTRVQQQAETVITKTSPSTEEAEEETGGQLRSQVHTLQVHMETINRELEQLLRRRKGKRRE